MNSKWIKEAYYLTTIDNIGKAKIEGNIQNLGLEFPQIDWNMEIIPLKEEKKLPDYKLITLKYLGDSLFQETSSKVMIENFKELEEKNPSFTYLYECLCQNPISLYDGRKLLPIIKPIDDNELLNMLLREEEVVAREKMQKRVEVMHEIDRLMEKSREEYNAAIKIFTKKM